MNLEKALFCALLIATAGMTFLPEAAAQDTTADVAVPCPFETNQDTKAGGQDLATCESVWGCNINTGVCYYGSCDINLGACYFGDCDINLGACYAGDCEINTGWCIYSDCGINTGICVWGGYCDINTGACYWGGYCDINLGSCHNGGYCDINLGECAYGGSCWVNLGVCYGGCWVNVGYCYGFFECANNAALADVATFDSGKDSTEAQSGFSDCTAEDGDLTPDFELGETRL